MYVKKLQNLQFPKTYPSVLILKHSALALGQSTSHTVSHNAQQ